MRERRPAHRLGHDRYKWDCYGDMQDAYTPIPRKRVKQTEKRDEAQNKTEENTHARDCEGNRSGAEQAT